MSWSVDEKNPQIVMDGETVAAVALEPGVAPLIADAVNVFKGLDAAHIQIAANRLKRGLGGHTSEFEASYLRNIAAMLRKAHGQEDPYAEQRGLEDQQPV